MEADTSLEVEVEVPAGCFPGTEILVTHGEQSVTVVIPEAAKTDDSHVLPPELSDTSDEEMEQVATAKFAIGAPVEVLRTDGGWTLATVTHFDDGGFTYTVRLTDGRDKYFVEEEDLRIPRFLLLSTANL